MRRWFSSLRRWGMGFLGMLLVLACNQLLPIPAGRETAAPPDVAATAAAMVAQTLQASQAAQTAVPTQAAPTMPPLPSPTPLPPTATPLPATAAPPTATPPPAATDTPEAAVTFTANANTNCRQGPGVYYPAVGSVMAGETVPVLARTNAVEGYWLVRLSDGRTCWAWDRYATVSGNADAVAVVTPPPAPDAAFSLLYVGPSECGAIHGLTFKIINRGSVAIESVYLEIGGTPYNVTAGLRFQWWLDCSRNGSANTIYPGHDVMVTLPTGSEDFRGHRINLYVKACTEDYLNGTCFERTIPLTP